MLRHRPRRHAEPKLAFFRRARVGRVAGEGMPLNDEEGVPPAADDEALAIELAHAASGAVDFLGATDPDTGVNTLMETVGECPEQIKELWGNLKIEILLDLLADYDTTKAVTGGDYPSVCNG